ncbi:MAG TPA: arginine--tRNA ligase [Chloroflexota bacterium]|nr:arginine--tRNA ligase [Chloroflexota bacterium]
MIKHELERLVEEAIARASERGDLPVVPAPEVVLERPPKAELGDYATSVALRLQRAARMAPQAVAGAITHHLEQPAAVAAVQVAGPGFVNFFLADEWIQDQVDVILRQGAAFGRVPLGNGRRVQVEFVSANPTGPLHVGAARNAALGDTLANLLVATDHRVEREYYINDAGSRMEALGASVWARYRQLHGLSAELPADGYEGEYVTELAQEISAERGRSLLETPSDEAIQQLSRLAEERVMAWIERDLADMGVDFDRWYSEQSLFDNGLFDTALGLLRDGGHVVEREGAIWFASSELGEDRDNVLIRSNGQPTYFASDVAYHYDKFLVRGFDRVIDVWAADHQGHVPRMKAMVRALGIDPDRLVVLLYQLVKLFKDGQELKMSKRAGTYVTVRELLDEVGADAARFFLIARSSDVTMNFDLDLARQQSEENPVYYVQYAHARISSILRHAGNADWSSGDVRLLATEPELGLIRSMLQFPELVETATLNLAPHHLPFFAQELASVFHAFYRDCRVVSDDPGLTRARLKLVSACRIVLANCLRLMGVSAPDRM